MQKKSKPNKGKMTQIILLAVGGVVGFFVGQYIVEAMKHSGEDIEFGLEMFVIYVASVILAIFLQIIIHELGHLVFGLFSGYRFCSFRIGKIMLIKEEGKIKIKKFSLAGTDGQCLMTPPDVIDSNIPYVLYNMGGVIFNVLSAGIFLGIYFLGLKVPAFSAFMMANIFFGVFLALANGIPLRLALVSNDGHNVLSIRKNTEARKCFVLQLKINEQVTKGVRMKDMPEEWFYMPEKTDRKNSICSAVGVFYFNRLLDQKDFAAAKELGEKLIEESEIPGIYKYLIINELIFLEIIDDRRIDVIESMQSKEFKQFAKKMSSYPSIVRTKYAYQLKVKGNVLEAGKLLHKFEKIERTYPYTGDIAFERELIELIEGN